MYRSPILGSSELAIKKLFEVCARDLRQRVSPDGASKTQKSHTMAHQKTKRETANSRLLTVLTLAGAITALALRTNAAIRDIAEIQPSARPQFSSETMTISHHRPSGHRTSWVEP